MRRSLPSRAHLDHLRKQAKDLLKAARNGEPEAVDRLVARLTRLSSPEDAAEDVTLQEAQFVLAREYGFANWAELLSGVPDGGSSRYERRVRSVHERLVAAVDRHVGTSLGRRVEAKVVEVTDTTFGAHVRSLGPSFWSYRFHVGGCEGWSHLVLTPALCTALVVDDDGREGAELFRSPPFNELIGKIPGHAGTLWVEYATGIARFVKALAPEIEGAWEPVFPLEMSDINLQTEPWSVELNEPSVRGIRAWLEINAEGFEGLGIGFCYPLSMLEATEVAGQGTEPVGRT